MMRNFILKTILINLMLIGGVMSAIEVPKYEVIESNDKIEVRQYQPMVIAEVTVKEDRKRAATKGFRLLADYIFGNNIDMTAPVEQKPDGDAWKISFFMPSKYNIDELPTPNNELVTLKQIPQKKFVVIRFSGVNSDSNLQKHIYMLKLYVAENNISVNNMKYAFYSTPFTLPAFRRNEILMEITD